MTEEDKEAICNAWSDYAKCKISADNGASVDDSQYGTLPASGKCANTVKVAFVGRHMSRGKQNFYRTDPIWASLFNSLQ